MESTQSWHGGGGSRWSRCGCRSTTARNFSARPRAPPCQSKALRRRRRRVQEDWCLPRGWWQQGDKVLLLMRIICFQAACRVLTHNPVQWNLLLSSDTWAHTLQNVIICPHLYLFGSVIYLIKKRLVTSELVREITQTRFFHCVEKIYMLVLVLCWCLIDF